MITKFGIGIECEFSILLDTKRTNNGNKIYLPICDVNIYILNPDKKEEFKDFIFNKLKNFTKRDMFPPTTEIYN